MFNTLGGYEFKLKKHKSIDISVRNVYAGGRRIIPFVDDLSIKREDYFDYNKAYEEKVNDYFRLDLRISFIQHRKRATHEWAIDITNLTNHINEYNRYYDDKTGEILKNYQQGFFPMGLYRLCF